MKPVLLIDTLKQPDIVSTFRPAEWEQVIPQARAAGLLSRLAVLLDAHHLLDHVPDAPRAYLSSALAIARQHAGTMRWELHAIEEALAPLGIPVVLLKGAAYLALDLPVGHGRLFSDMDIMVPHAELNRVEAAMMRSGWVTTHLDEYDQRYYRQWMHEIPPMIHSQRGNVIDIHHAIVPPTSRIPSEAALLFSAAQALAGSTCLRVLAPIDLVLHSATHLFLEGEFPKGLRDLMDLDGLIRHFQAERSFWPQFETRARELGLWRPAAYALRYSQRILGTPIPEAVLRSAKRELGNAVGLALRDMAFMRALRPFHPTTWDALTPAMLWALYLRGHWLRMPFGQLTQHLWHKAFVRPKEEEATP